ncbi:MAG: hypothetical protein LBP83_01205 [Dysgonamonadaceae bacterium]|jgi:hypothetical protein|nr:hypothetical protein [Dysgonamonadaceae bacterium]
MRKIKLFLFVVFGAILPSVLLAQNSTKSPYTRYGYGKLADRAYGSHRGMGGIGLGLRNSQVINPLNPASFSNVDSMTFMFDFGMMGQLAWYEEGQNKSKKTNANLEYIAMQFPLTSNLGMGLGFEPVSFIGYNYYGSNGTDASTQSIYTGNGGLNKIYASLSYKFSERFSGGVNVGYLFGNIVYNKQIVPLSGGNTMLWVDTLHSSSIVYEAGLQYVIPAGKDKALVLGAVFSPKIKLNNFVGKGEYSINASNIIQGSPYIYSTNDSVFEFPETYGLGLTYNIKNKLTTGLDVHYQKWASAKFYDKTDTLSNRLKINVGGEYIPDYRSNKFFKRVHYRAGAYYSNSYVKIAGKGFKEYGASLGFGFPMQDRRSFLNLAFDYTLVSPDVKSIQSEKKEYTFINEQYFRITISYTFNELWFFKRKVQ